MINGAGCAVGFVVVHGVPDREATHEIANPWFAAAEIFAEDEMEAVREEEKSVDRYRGRPKLGSVAFVDHGLRGEALDPRERGGIGEADVVGEEEEKVLVVGVRGEELGPLFGVVLEMIVNPWFKVAE